MGFTADIYEKMAQGSIFVLTSIFEGFGMVITEAMACGIPVVSYDCPTGPSEIIIQGENGYLVPMHAEEEIADKINLLIENVEMRKKMGLKAKESAKFYSLEKILPKWTDILRKTSL
jgi:glycosyltransferase involved in cell wall biosynthesis